MSEFAKALALMGEQMELVEWLRFVRADPWRELTYRTLGEELLSGTALLQRPFKE